MVLLGTKVALMRVIRGDRVKWSAKSFLRVGFEVG